MHQLPPLVDKRVLLPAQTARALRLVSDLDLLRLKAIARLYARGLPPEMTWEDILQESFARIIAGTRQRPDGVNVVAFVAGIMRSLRSEYLHRLQPPDALRVNFQDEGPDLPSLPDTRPGPEQTLNARQELKAINLLFSKDAAALKIIRGLGQGLSASQIRQSIGLSKTDYDSTRRRMRRILLRSGLACETK